MKSVFTYLVVDESTVYAETSTRQLAREYLKEAKSGGNKSIKIYQEEYVRVSYKQVR